MALHSSESVLLNCEFEDAIARLVPRGPTELNSKSPLDESVFDRVRKLLELAGRIEWSKRPRTYAILLMSDRLDAMDAFVDAGLFDIQLPYRHTRLLTPLQDEESRKRFLALQSLVLTKGTALEKGQHKHFATTAAADSCFLQHEILGSGRHGIVDRVTSKLSITAYARKRIKRRTFPRGQDATRDFEREIEVLKHLEHYHLVKYAASYTDPDHVALLITPVAELDLRTFLQQRPTQQLFVLQHAFGCLSAAVHYLHSQGCRHKDIKPANVLIINGTVLLTDFGTARSWGSDESGTTTGMVGPYTPAYAAPEVVEREPRNEASDIWSLGCVFLDIITVLKGQTLDDRTMFFEKTGSGNRNPRNNHQAYLAWLDKIRDSSREHNEPIRWIRLMLLEGPRQRIEASGLLERIRSYHDLDQEHIYYGHCCAGEETDLSSICRSSLAADPKSVISSLDGSAVHVLSSDPSPTDLPSNYSQSSQASHEKLQPQSIHGNAQLEGSKPKSTRTELTTTEMEMCTHQQNFDQTSEGENESTFTGTRSVYTQDPAAIQEWQDRLHEHLARFRRSLERKTAEPVRLHRQPSHKSQGYCSPGIHFTLRHITVTAEDLCEWILGVCLQDHRGQSKELESATSLCLLILTFSLTFATADNCIVDFLSARDRDRLIAFGREGRKCRRSFEKLLRKYDRLLRNEILHPRDQSPMLPSLSAEEAKGFLNLVGGHLQDLGTIMEEMSEWCSVFEKEWLSYAIVNQSNEPVDKLNTSHTAAKLCGQDRVLDSQVDHSPGNDTTSIRLRSAYCTERHCFLCGRKPYTVSYLALPHALPESDIIVHTTCTSISRAFINTTALKEIVSLAWVCGIRDRRCYLFVREGSDVPDEDKNITGTLQELAPRLPNSFNVVPGRINGNEIAKLVARTTKIRQAQRAREANNGNTYTVPSRPQETTLTRPAAVSAHDYRRRPAGSTKQRSTRRLARRSTEDGVGGSNHQIRRQRSYGTLISQDHSLEHTLALVRKASAWFRKIAGGRRSAPPHENAGSKGLEIRKRQGQHM